MSQPPELPPVPLAQIGYQTPTFYDPAAVADLSHLKLLALFHYIWGGLVMLLSSLGVIYIVLGAFLLRSVKPEEALIGWFFIAIGAVVVVLGWGLGLLYILSGRWMVRRKRRIASIVLAAIACLSVPLGTLLGVFTLIVLFRPTVVQLYDSQAPAA